MVSFHLGILNTGVETIKVHFYFVSAEMSQCWTVQLRIVYCDCWWQCEILFPDQRLIELKKEGLELRLPTRKGRGSVTDPRRLPHFSHPYKEVSHSSDCKGTEPRALPGQKERKGEPMEKIPFVKNVLETVAWHYRLIQGCSHHFNSRWSETRELEIPW